MEDSWWRREGGRVEGEKRVERRVERWSRREGGRRDEIGAAL